MSIIFKQEHAYQQNRGTSFLTQKKMLPKQV